MTRQSTIFGGGGDVGGFGYLPGIRAKGFKMNRAITDQVVPGFDGDGDVLALPTQSGGSLIYYDITGTLVWSFVTTDIEATMDNWASMFINANNVLVVLVSDNGGAGFTQLCTIDKAGTITLVGGVESWNTAPGAIQSPIFSASNTAQNTACMFPRPDGDYALFVVEAALGIYEVIINSATGVPTFTATGVFAFPDPTFDVMTFWLRSDLKIVGDTYTTNTVDILTPDVNGDLLVTTFAKYDSGNPNYLALGKPPSAATKTTMVNLNLEIIIYVRPASSALRTETSICWDITEFDNYMTFLADCAGVAP